jgi:GTP-binding protein
MLPVIALVGRPNTGKSTLFNRLTRTRNALISDHPGTTRDRQYGEANLEGQRALIIDTGGLTEKTDEIGELITSQAQLAIEEADHILFLVDGRAGITPEDKMIATLLRKLNKSILLVVNKTEGRNPDLSTADAYELGMGNPIAISSAHGTGITQLIESIFPKQDNPEEDSDHINDIHSEMNHETDVDAESNSENDTPIENPNIKLAIIGKPNVGKSTLTNRMLGEDRVIVHDSPGTTRDSIYIPLERFGKQYTLIDTAGVRKRTKITEVPEKFSVVKTLQSIEDTNVVIYVIDARIGVSEQDMKLLGFILECGKALVIAINKWDGMSDEDREHARNTIDRHLDFVKFARVHFISALHGSGVGNLFNSVDEAYQSATKKLSTPLLSRLLEKAVATHQPPLVHGRRVKLRYAHPHGYNPPCIMIHGNQLDALPDSYKRFLIHFFQEKLDMHGTPVRIKYRNSENPFAKK